MIANAFPDPSSFCQVNLGFRLTPRAAISLEAFTWKYRAPLGILYGSSHGSTAEESPGKVRGSGVGFAYQDLLWKGLYSSPHALPLWQRYSDTNGRKIQDGFQLITTLRTGYQVRLSSDRWFLEPSVAVAAWPINTNVPAAFAVGDAESNRYLLFEMRLHFRRMYLLLARSEAPKDCDVPACIAQACRQCARMTEAVESWWHRFEFAFVDPGRAGQS